MNQIVSAFSSSADTAAAAAELVHQIQSQLPRVDALVVFCSSRHDYPTLLSALNQGLAPGHLVGCSSAGEFVGTRQTEGGASLIAFASDELAFSAGLGQGIAKDPANVARDIIASFRSPDNAPYQHKYALIFNDPLSGRAEELIEALALECGGGHQIFGGGAGDDAAFRKTHVFCGDEAYTDAAVGLEILSHRPIGIGIRHGWRAATPIMRVTEAHGQSVYSLNATPVDEFFTEYAQASAQKLDRDNPLPFFLHNILGVKKEGGYRLAVPLGFDGRGGLNCCASVPEGAPVSIMSPDETGAADAARDAARDAISQLEGNKPGAALFFDCVATRLRIGKGFGNELQAVAAELGSVPVVGCNTYGQVAQVSGQLSGFHNCTAVVCVFPE